MFYSPLMGLGREFRSRNEVNQQTSTSRKKAASAAVGSMNTAKVKESEGCSQSHDQARSVISRKSDSSSDLLVKVVAKTKDRSHSEENRAIESSSRSVSETTEGGSGQPENGGGDGSFLNRSKEAASRVTISRRLDNTSKLEESEDLTTNINTTTSEMGNTHWSQSYTGVRQCVSMRPSCRSDSANLTEDLNEVYVPIIGYEMMEQRTKFTVFKLHVQKNTKESWFIFRRYTDFERLNEQLAYLFPNFLLALPPKKWFGNNFDPIFLEDRQLGLQAFLNNICGHKDIVISDCVREFLCVDDPPGPHDSLEESRALCESLEETVYNLKRDLTDRERKIETLTEELANSRRRVEALSIQQMIRSDRVLPVSPNGSDTTDIDRQSCAEADQQDYSPEQEERPIVISFADKKLKPSSEATDTELGNHAVFTSIPLEKSSSDTKDAPLISTSEVIRVT